MEKVIASKFPPEIFVKEFSPYGRAVLFNDVAHALASNMDKVIK